MPWHRYGDRSGKPHWRRRARVRRAQEVPVCENARFAHRHARADARSPLHQVTVESDVTPVRLRCEGRFRRPRHRRHPDRSTLRRPRTGNRHLPDKLIRREPRRLRPRCWHWSALRSCGNGPCCSWASTVRVASCPKNVSHRNAPRHLSCPNRWAGTNSYVCLRKRAACPGGSPLRHQFALLSCTAS